MDRAILVHAAMVGYGQDPEFDLRAPRQNNMSERIAWEIRHGAGPLRRAVEADGLLGDWEQQPGEKAKL
jgi:hypothetical protein